MQRWNLVWIKWLVQLVWCWAIVIKQSVMLFNYFKLAIRLLIRNPFFTFINVLGLSVGFAVLLVLWQHADYGLKADRFHKDHKRIFRLYFDFYHNTGVDWAHYLCGAFPPAFTSIAKEKFTEIENTTRILHQINFDDIMWAGPQTDTGGWSNLDPKIVISYIAKDGQRHSFRETNAAYADPNLFEFFSIPLITGEPNSVLSSPNAIVISSATAKKYFGNDDPMGRVLILNDSESFTVTGVFHDLPKNSHLNFELVFSTLGILHAIENVTPFQQSAHNYFKLRNAVSVADLENKLNIEQRRLWDFKSWPGATLSIFLQPLKDVPFRIFDNDAHVPQSRYLFHAFQVVAMMVLVMAWINYLNLKLSRQAARLKELGSRKAAGAGKSDFIKQFLVESMVINSMAILVAVTLIQLLKYPLETSFQFYLPARTEIPLSSLSVFGGMMIVGVLIAGLHPALSAWPVTIHKSLRYNRLPERRTGFVQVSAVFQFVSAIVLIVWLFSVSTQVDFVTSDTWGLDRNRVVIIDMPVMGHNDISVEINTLKNEIISTAGIDDAALSTTVAGDLLENRLGFNRTDTTSLWTVPKSDGGVDERFIPFYGLKILAGRNFIKDNPADRRSVILSRQAAKSVGLEPEEAIGKMLRVEKYSWRPFGTLAEIIGVIEDHRYNPLYRETGIANGNRGTILTYGDYLFPKSQALKMSVRIKGDDINDIIPRIQERYVEIFPDQIFHWYFLNDHMNVHYKSEKVARNQILLFTCIAIGIACLGLVGMISNRVVEKTKEIGIRKILGAKLGHIVRILINTTIKQVTVATLIGIPLAHYLTQQYLEKFSERIILEWWHFAFPTAMMIAILFFTIASVLWKAVRRNPVDALRYE